jgi:hypothetical protein
LDKLRQMVGGDESCSQLEIMQVGFWGFCWNLERIRYSEFFVVWK